MHSSVSLWHAEWRPCPALQCRRWNANFKERKIFPFFTFHVHTKENCGRNSDDTVLLFYSLWIGWLPLAYEGSALAGDKHFFS